MNSKKNILIIILFSFSYLHAVDLTDIQITAPKLLDSDITNQAI